MAKQVLKVTDFTGGINTLSDARDIGDTQFAQNWNAALDKTGIVRYSGGGIQSIFNLPQDNTNQVNGFGLFRFTTDYSINILNSDLNVGIETGTIDDYTSQTVFTLEDTDTVSSADDYYNGMTILIYSGTGVGKSRNITDYAGSSRTITCDSFGTTLHDKGDGTPSKYIIIPWGVDGSFGNGSDIDWITEGGTAADGSSSGFPTAVDTPNTGASDDYYFLTKTATIDDESHASLGYIEYKNSLTLKAGVNYTLSFDCRAARKWFNYVSDGEGDGTVIKSDQVPWVYLTSANANLGLYSNGESASFIDISGQPTYDALQSNYVDNGDFQDGIGTGWTEVDSGSDLTFAEDASSTAYGGHDGTAVLTSIEGFTFDGSPSSYIYSDNMGLVEETPHHVNFVYASTDGIAYSIYDATNSADIIPWTILPPTSSASTYNYANEEIDETSGYNKKQARYITFTTPINSGGTGTNVQIRFAPVKAGSVARVSGVTVRKAVCDINTMSYNGSGVCPFLDSQIKNWNNYSIKFTIPESDYATERDDWVLRIFGGLATHRASATDSEDTQTVYIGNIRLASDEKDTVTLLNDNTSTASYITMYSNSKSSWDTRFMSWSGLSSEPSYDYINGTLKVSDGNFKNANSNFLMYRYDRKLMNKYFNSGWVSQQYSLPNSPNTIITSTNEDGMFGTRFDCISYANTLYSGLEYRNANKPSPGTYLNEEDGKMVVQRGVDSNGNHWKDGYWTNWDMDEVDKSVLLRYAYHNYSSGSTYISNVVNPVSTQGGHKGYKDSEQIELSDLEERDGSDGDGTFYINAQKHATNRGIRNTSGWDISAIANSQVPYGRGAVCFLICGTDPENQSSDMNTVIGDGKIVSKVNFSFLHEFQTSKWVGYSNNETMNDTSIGLPYFEVSVWKIDNSEGNIKPGGTKNCTYNTIANQSIKYEQLAADGDEIYFPEVEGSKKTVYPGKGDSDAARYWNSDNLEEWQIISKIVPVEGSDGVIKLTSRLEGEIHFTKQENLTSNDDLFISIKEVYPDSLDFYQLSFGRQLSYYAHVTQDAEGLPGTNYSNWFTDFAFYTKIKMENLNIGFFGDNYDEDTSNVQDLSDDLCQVNFNFAVTDGVDAAGWGEGIFRLATSSVNIFDEESGLNENKSTEIGASSSGGGTITLGFAPNITLTIANSLLRDKFKKKTKFYMKKVDSDIWYLQFYIDHEKVLLHSTTSSKKVSGTINANKDSTMFMLPREGMANFNEVDSYESQTGISQENAIVANNALLDCRYKTSVVANNRLYVGNIKQNGTVFGDRMIKSPINKYNILPSTNFIDVAINDGDEITALEFYKDKLLQFKKRKVFVINTSGDYEFLEDTFDNIGVQRQCQVTKTSMGIAWANSSGCFLYDGQQVSNLIDGKLGTEAFQSQIGNNYWNISNSDIPAIGYIKSTKKLIIAKNVESHTINAMPTMWQFDFVSQGWIFLFQKQKVQTNNTAFAPSNFISDENGDILWYTKQSGGLGLIYKWNDSPVTNTHASAILDNFYFISKDFDFGNPAVRKKIYKVYVTFKSYDDSNGNVAFASASAAHSNIKVQYATDGNLNSWTEFSTNSTNYDTTNGLSDGASSKEWITAELKPSSSINNVYSFALRFIGAQTNIPNRFEINDFSIIYRIKRPK